MFRRCVFVLVSSLIVVGAFATGAVAASWTSYGTFVSFNSSGVALCGQHRAGVDSSGVHGNVRAWGTTRAMKNGCEDAHSRPAGFHATAVALITAGGSVCSATGWSYSTIPAAQWEIGTSSTECGGNGYYRSRARGGQWDGDSEVYLYATADEYKYSVYMTKDS